MKISGLIILLALCEISGKKRLSLQLREFPRKFICTGFANSTENSSFVDCNRRHNAGLAGISHYQAVAVLGYAWNSRCHHHSAGEKRPSYLCHLMTISLQALTTELSKIFKGPRVIESTFSSSIALYRNLALIILLTTACRFIVLAAYETFDL